MVYREKPFSAGLGDQRFQSTLNLVEKADLVEGFQ